MCVSVFVFAVLRYRELGSTSRRHWCPVLCFGRSFLSPTEMRMVVVSCKKEGVWSIAFGNRVRLCLTAFVRIFTSTMPLLCVSVSPCNSNGFCIRFFPAFWWLVARLGWVTLFRRSPLHFDIFISSRWVGLLLRFQKGSAVWLAAGRACSFAGGACASGSTAHGSLVA